MAATTTRKRKKKADAPPSDAAETTGNAAETTPEPVTDPAIAAEVAEHRGTQVDNEPLDPTKASTGDEPTVFIREQELGVDSGYQLIPFNMVFRRDNVRTVASLRLEEMVSSLMTRGYKSNHPIIVSQKPDGRFLVLCGNRRTEGLEVISEREQEAFIRVLPDGMIPAIVHEGLTEDDEILIRIDHSADEDRVPLDEWGEFLAVKQLVRAGYDSQANIAAKLGKYDDKKQPKRSWVQQRVNLARLPRVVQDAMEAYCMQGAGASHMRWGAIASLYKIFLKEFNVGHREGGPEFRTAFDAVINPLDDPDTGKKPSALSGKAMASQAQNLSSRAVQRTLMKSAGQPTDVTAEGKPYIEDWAEIDADAVRCETAELQLTRIATHLGQEKFNNILDELPPIVAEEVPPTVEEAEAAE